MYTFAVEPTHTWQAFASKVAMHSDATTCSDTEAWGSTGIMEADQPVGMQVHGLIGATMR